MKCPLARLHKASAATVLNIVEFIKRSLLVGLLVTSEVWVWPRGYSKLQLMQYLISLSSLLLLMWVRFD